jgi:3-oxoacyl-[acyl-carrier protein] reductase
VTSVALPASFDLTGRVAIVTGASGPTGIGYAAARHLGMLGAAVVVGATTDRSHERASEPAAQGISATGFVGDLTDEATAEALVRAALAAHGRLDIVVNNAGMVSTSDPDYLEGDLLATTPQRWSESLRRNLDTAYLVTRAALPHLRASGGW